MNLIKSTPRTPTKNKFYTTCQEGHRYHISWDFCPHCPGEWKDYHESAAGYHRREAARHEAAIVELEKVNQ